MGFGNISPLSLLLIFLIIIVIFGSSKLRTIGEDLGQAFKSFKKGLSNSENDFDDKNEKKDDKK